MISNLKIKNVQSHKDSEFDFHPGVNVITGPSDVGKSTVIRSLKWGARNRPSGDALRRHRTKSTEVTLNNLVTRMRSGSKNQYELSGKTFKALGTGVPEEIESALRLSDDNFQEQHDAYFLIGDSPGQVARTLNNVTGLQIIDLSLKRVREKIKEAKSRKVFQKEELKKQEEKIEKLQWVVEADVDYAEIEKVQREADSIQVEELAAQISLVEDLRSKVDGIPSTTDDRAALAAAESALNVDLSLEDLIETIEANQVTIPDVREDIIKVIGLIPQVEEDWSDLQVAITAVTNAGVVCSQFPAEIDDPTEHVAYLTALESEISDLQEAVNEFLVAEDSQEYAAQAYTQGKIDLEEKMREVGVCPLCGSDTCEIKVEEVV